MSNKSEGEGCRHAYISLVVWMSCSLLSAAENIQKKKTQHISNLIGHKSGSPTPTVHMEIVLKAESAGCRSWLLVIYCELWFSAFIYLMETPFFFPFSGTFSSLLPSEEKPMCIDISFTSCSCAWQLDRPTLNSKISSIQEVRDRFGCGKSEKWLL